MMTTLSIPTALLPSSSQLSDFADMHAARSMEDLARISLGLMRRATRADTVIFALTDNENGRCIGAFEPADCDLPRFMPIYESLWHENPIGQRTLRLKDDSTCRLDDAIERSELVKRGFYSEYLRAARIEDMMTGYMSRRDRYRLALTAVRSRGRFSADERDAMEHVRRHTVTAFWNFARIAQLSREPVTIGDLMNSGLRTTMIIRDNASPDEPPKRTLPPFTPTEKKVLLGLTEGKSNAEIAAVQGSSVRTVHKHVEHILEKLAVDNRTAAVVRTLSMRLLD